MAYTYPPALIGAIFLTNLRWQFAGQTLRNQFHWRLEQNTNGRTIEQVYDALHATLNVAGGLYDKMVGLADSLCVLIDAGQQQIRLDRYAGKGYLLNKPGTNVNVGIDVTQLAAVLTRRAVVATRRGVSSLHIPLSADDAMIDAGVLSAVALTRVGEVGNSILGINNLGDGMNVRPIIYHRGATPEFNYIETFIAQPQVRVVRRRTVGLGE